MPLVRKYTEEQLRQINFQMLNEQPVGGGAAPAPDPTWFDVLDGVANFTSMHLTDDPAYFDLTGDDVNTWYEAQGITAMDLAFDAGTKALYDTTHPVNATGKSFYNQGVACRYIAGATGKSSLLWPSGVGSSYYALKIVGAIDDGSMALARTVSHGDMSSWGAILRIAERGIGSGVYRIAHTVYDGSTKTAELNDAGGPEAGWHLIAVRNTGTNLFLKVDDYDEVDAGGAGAMTYLDGVFRILSPFNDHQNVATAAMLHSSDHDDVTRDAVMGVLQGLITDLP